MSTFVVKNSFLDTYEVSPTIFRPALVKFAERCNEFPFLGGAPGAQKSPDCFCKCPAKFRAMSAKQFSRKALRAPAFLL